MRMTALSVACAALILATPMGVQAQSSSGDWLTYQHDNQRSGVADGSFPNPANASIQWESQPLDGLVYAQPLRYGREGTKT